MFADADDVTDSADDIHVPDDDDDFLPKPAGKLKAGYSEPEDKDSKVRSGPPVLNEWQDFFSRIVIRTATDFYIDQAFRGIDEDRLSDHEIERIRMAQEERDRIAHPFAEFANKNKWMRKHGRAIISGAGMSDSFIALGMWYRRVNRIARKYKAVKINVGSGQSEQAYANGQYSQPRYFSPGG